MRYRTVALVIGTIGLVLAAAFGPGASPADASSIGCDVNATPGNAQQKIDGAGPGTIICLEPGVYGRLFVYQKSDLLIFGSGQHGIVVTDEPYDHTCILVLESQNIWLHNMVAYGCKVQGVFVGDSTSVRLTSIQTIFGPIGFQFRNSTGQISGSRAQRHASSTGAGFGALVQNDSTVQILGSLFDNIAGFGILSQHGTNLEVRDTWVVANRDGGIFTVRESGTTTIKRSVIAANGLNVFAGMPGCAGLPAADATPPACYLEDPGAYYSDIALNMSYSVVHGSPGTGVVIFPGVSATLRRNKIQYNEMTGLFAWGARVDSRHDRYTKNRENGVECRAYPAPSTGDRGLCNFRYAWIDRSRPLPGNVLGGGFVSEGAKVYLKDSWVEFNWGVGVQGLHNAAGQVSNNAVRYNGGTAFCISGSPNLAQFGNTTTGNRSGECRGHP